MSALNVVASPVKTTLVTAWCFDASRIRSTEEADFFMKNWNGHIAVPFSTCLVLYTNMKIRRNPAIDFGSKESQVCGFIYVFISFKKLVMFWETVWLYFENLLSSQYFLFLTALRMRVFTVWMSMRPSLRSCLMRCLRSLLRLNDSKHDLFSEVL